MQLNSVYFLLFMTAVAVIYLKLPKRFQSAFLLIASFVFYFIGARQYLLVLLATIALNFYAGGLIEKVKKRGMRTAKAVVAAGIERV